jgi:aminoglycoside phosphotransferase (APT) family kinase protein
MDEVKFDSDRVRALLRGQTRIWQTSDYEMSTEAVIRLWRLGDELAVRLPRADRAPALLDLEQTWLPVLADQLPLPTPIPVRIGRPSPLWAHLDDRALSRG